jgi:hypothetical protein
VIMFDIAEWVVTFFFFSLGSLLFSLALLIGFHVFLQIIERFQYES